MLNDEQKNEILENIVKYINDAYNEGYDDGSKLAAKKESSYENGLEDAWNIARKLLSSTNAYIKQLQLNNDDEDLTATKIICDYGVLYIKQKVEEIAKNSQSIQAGDEVVAITETGVEIKMYVIDCLHTADCLILNGITNSGNLVLSTKFYRVYKTGITNYKLREALEEIKNRI